MGDEFSCKTLGEIKRLGSRLTANCIGRDCGHGRDMDLDPLIKQYGRNHSIIDETKISSRLSCQACGHVGGRLTIRPPGSGR